MAKFETEHHIGYHGLSGIVTEHPDYTNNEFAVERLVAIREDLIDENRKVSGRARALLVEASSATAGGAAVIIETTW